ncbi:enolase C-terminal domain-like protein [Pseudactinotalea sp. Z1748]|uniref:enolase C-terminal domain-like protein n=1 Tax=Pseudactinotalea sp. Z1748 TaxID=3413027 RepID=UPI003C79DFEA
MGQARASDVRPVDFRVEFVDVALDPPFVISGRPMTHFTAAAVHLDVQTRDGRAATGLGASMLSVPWAWPSRGAEVPGPDIEARDDVLRGLVHTFADQVLAGVGGDPFDIWRPIYHRLDETLTLAARSAGSPPIPRLAGLLALAAVDNAVHDAWSRAAGRSVYEMYSDEYLNEDLGWAGLPGTYPGDHLGQPRNAIPVQHVLGVGDPLTDAAAGAEPGARSLNSWMAAEGIKDLKLKLQGSPSADAERIAAVYRVGSAARDDVTLSIDPNEAYGTVAELDQMLDELETLAPRAAAAVTYLEQPFPRDVAPDAEQMKALARRTPLLMDEGYSRLSQLDDLVDRGWSGVVIKASKGQSHAMATYAIARSRGLQVVIQDLTTTGAALEHSIGLASALQVTWPHLEYNSRQYAPGANEELAARSPGLVTVRDGQVRFTRAASGLYGA